VPSYILVQIESDDLAETVSRERDHQKAAELNINFVDIARRETHFVCGLGFGLKLRTVYGIEVI